MIYLCLLRRPREQKNTLAHMMGVVDRSAVENMVREIGAQRNMDRRGLPCAQDRRGGVPAIESPSKCPARQTAFTRGTKNSGSFIFCVLVVDYFWVPSALEISIRAASCVYLFFRLSSTTVHSNGKAVQRRLKTAFRRKTSYDCPRLKIGRVCDLPLRFSNVCLARCR